MKKPTPPLPSDTIVHRMRLMAEAGGMLTKDRTHLIIEAANRIDELEERIAIMTEMSPLPPDALSFPPGGDDK